MTGFDHPVNNSGKLLKILVVDDDVLNQRMMNLLLSREGYQITSASNGVEAVEMVKTGDFDVVLMDLQMPVMDGMSASRLIRDWENGNKHTFIVALTASFLPEKGHELFDAGIDNYISKPFDLEHLKQILRYSHNESRGIAEKRVEERDPSESGVSFVAGVRRVGGSEEIYRELLSDFVQELPEKLERMESYQQNNEPTALSRLAHNLRGVSANLGGMRLSEQAGALEKKVDIGGSEKEIKHIIGMVRAAAEEFRTNASNYLSK
jgi:CheY-like chemotaxis protein/HPt (histidine-containing phosphotransfer) domain-containing protein